MRERDMVIDVVIGIAALGLSWLALGVRIVKQYERGVVFRFGRALPQPRDPGLTLITPVVDRLQKVNLQIVTMPVPAQEGITRDNVTVRVDAVVYFKVIDPIRAVVDVQDYLFAVGQVAQTSLRSIIGKSDLDDLLSNRERLNQGLEVMIDNPALGWGIHIDRVEIKDVALPESMKRSMSRQAEAERERRARIITADGELQASEKLAAAATTMANTPSALQLRLLQTMVEVAAEKNSTVLLPFPVELLRFLDRASITSPSAAAESVPPDERAPATPAAAEPPADTPAAEPGSATAPASEPAAGTPAAAPARTAEPAAAREPAAAGEPLAGEPAAPTPRAATEQLTADHTTLDDERSATGSTPQPS
jgi:regulator of protease activity HflC (stomatin/prohibitin superfamily)